MELLRLLRLVRFASWFVVWVLLLGVPCLQRGTSDQVGPTCKHGSEADERSRAGEGLECFDLKNLGDDPGFVSLYILYFEQLVLVAGFASLADGPSWLARTKSRCSRRKQWRFRMLGSGINTEKRFSSRCKPCFSSCFHWESAALRFGQQTQLWMWLAWWLVHWGLHEEDTFGV